MATREINLGKDAVEHIVAGKKSLIVETISGPNDSPIKVGDILVISKVARRCVKAVRRYASLLMLVHNEDHRQIFPDATRAQTLRRLQSHFKEEEEKRGVLVYEIGPLLRLVPNKKK